MRYSTPSSDGSLMNACERSTVNGRNKISPGKAVAKETIGGETERFGLMVTWVAPTLTVLTAASAMRPTPPATRYFFCCRSRVMRSAVLEWESELARVPALESVTALVLGEASPWV